MKKDYLLAIDLDGTLIKNFDQYDEISFQHLKKLKETNKIVIATGRPWRSTRYYYELLDLDTPVINYNGALVHNPKSPAFKKTMITIPREVVVDLIRDLPDLLINVFCEIEDEIFLWKYTRKSSPTSCRRGRPERRRMDGILRGDPNGALVITRPDPKKRFRNM